MEITRYNLSRSQLENVLNNAKEEMFANLCRRKEISKDQFEKWASHLVVAMREKGIFGTLFDRLCGNIESDKGEVTILWLDVEEKKPDCPEDNKNANT